MRGILRSENGKQEGGNDKTGMFRWTITTITGQNNHSPFKALIPFLILTKYMLFSSHIIFFFFTATPSTNEKRIPSILTFIISTAPITCSYIITESVITTGLFFQLKLYTTMHTFEYVIYVWIFTKGR